MLHLDGWSIDDGSRRERHEAVYALIGTFAEPATLVRELTQDRDSMVVTGVLEADSEFAPHGHTVLLRVGGAEPAK